jgi:hypothetical protein
MRPWFKPPKEGRREGGREGGRERERKRGRERGREGRKEGRKEDQALGTTVYGDSIRKRTRSCQVTGSRVTEKK